MHLIASVQRIGNVFSRLHIHNILVLEFADCILALVLGHWASERCIYNRGPASQRLAAAAQIEICLLSEASSCQS